MKYFAIADYGRMTEVYEAEPGLQTKDFSDAVLLYYTDYDNWEMKCRNAMCEIDDTYKLQVTLDGANKRNKEYKKGNEYKTFKAIKNALNQCKEAATKEWLKNNPKPYFHEVVKICGFNKIEIDTIC